MYRSIRRYSLLLLLSGLPFAAMAWGLLGHRIIGQVAETYLTREARREVRKILGNESIAMSSNWADFVKSDSNYNYLYAWHYINIPAGKSQEQVSTILAADTGNAYARINFLTAQLKNKQLEQEKKVMYLRLLIHLVGDIHQPLHVGRPEDQGANKIKISWMGTPTNLHSLWDTRLIDFQDLSYTEYTDAINFTTKEQRKEWNAQPVAYWFWESYQIAEQLYGDIKEPDQKLEYKYNYKYLSTLNAQLLKGGVHLAGLLNRVFD